MIQNTTDTDPPREPSLIDIEVLDLGPLYQQAVEHYLALDPSRASWPEEKRRRLVIRTECRWGRVQLSPDTCFMVNERGEGPREPLSTSVAATVSLYAELKPVDGDAGFFESQPFCRVPIDAEAARVFRVLGIVALEDFLRAKIPEMEAVYMDWLSVLRKARDRVRSARAVRVETRN